MAVAPPTPVRANPVQVIINHAPKLGLDPVAVLAYALEEGGLHWGAVGDQGTSFGPFQAHIGGANPYPDTGHASGWANSPKGLVQMMGMMSRTSARGKKGKEAVKAIELEFGKGADPAETVRRAYAKMPQAQKVFEGTVAAPLGGSPPPPSPVSGSGRGVSVPPVASVSPAPIRFGMAPDLSLASPSPPDANSRLTAPSVEVTQAPAFKFRVVRGQNLPPVRVATDQTVAKPAPQTSGIVELARHYLGTKYVFGGSTPSGFDCSGFVQWLYAQRGITLPRTTFEQVHAGVAVSRDQLKPGDLVFFRTENDPRGAATHEGMAIGHGQFIQAPHTGDVVRISSLSDPYYQSRFVTARRVA